MKKKFCLQDTFTNTPVQTTTPPHLTQYKPNLTQNLRECRSLYNLNKKSPTVSQRQGLNFVFTFNLSRCKGKKNLRTDQFLIRIVLVLNFPPNISSRLLGLPVYAAPNSRLRYTRFFTSLNYCVKSIKQSAI